MVGEKFNNGTVSYAMAKTNSQSPRFKQPPIGGMTKHVIF